MDAQLEAGLVARAAKGETESFQTLFEEHHGAMFRFAYCLINDVDAAEDIAQECFVQLMRRPAFDPERGSLRQYLYGITRNLIRQHQRLNHREVQWDDEMDDAPMAAVATDADRTTSRELAAVVQAALSSLPPGQREAIVLAEFEELPLDEAAAVVGVDLGAFKSRLHRARESLRSRLAPYRTHVRMPLPKGTTL